MYFSGNIQFWYPPETIRLMFPLTLLLSLQTTTSRGKKLTLTTSSNWSQAIDKEERLQLFWKPGWGSFFLQTPAACSWWLGCSQGPSELYLVLWFQSISSQDSVRASQVPGGQLADLERGSLSDWGHTVGYRAGRRKAAQPNAAFNPKQFLFPRWQWLCSAAVPGNIIFWKLHLTSLFLF